MKNLLLAVALFFTGCISTYAQTDSTVQKPDDRIVFRSTVRQLTSYLDANDKSSAAILYDDVLEQMEQYVAETYKAIDTAKGSDKRKLEQKFNRQRMLTEQFKGFKSDIIRNRPSIHTWTDQFIETLY